MRLSLIFGLILLGPVHTFASESNSLLRSFKIPAVHPEKDLISGGFQADLQLPYRFATFADRTSDADIKRLLNRSRGRIPKELRSPIRWIAQDRYLFAALEQFLTDEGYFTFAEGDWPSSYHDEIPPYLHLVDKTPRALTHELLHYILDKMDAFIHEASVRGSFYSQEGHELMQPIENRLVIATNLRNGEFPIDKRIYYSYLTPPPEVLRDFESELRLKFVRELNHHDFGKLKAFVESEKFYKQYVNLVTQTYTLKEAREFLVQGKHDKNRFSESQLVELSKLHEFNAALIAQAVRLGADLAARTAGETLQQVVRTYPFQKSWQTFLDRFSTSMGTNPVDSVQKTAEKVLDQITCRRDCDDPRTR